MANKSNTPNIPSNSSKNVPPAVPQNKKQVPNIPGDVATNPIIPDLSEVGTDDNKWLLVTGDFSKDNNLISWIEKKDIKSHSTSLETCTLLSLTRKIQELKRGDYNTYIALLPPDKPELIYLYGGARRYDLYYYTFDFVYRLRDLEVDEWKEAAFNYFSKSLLPDFTDSDFIESGKTKEIHERWEGKFSEEFLNKVLKNIYLFVSPEETEYKIFQFLDNMLDSDDDNIDLDIDDLVDEDEIKENLDALVKDGLELSDSQEAILEEIANDMLQILKQSQKKNVQQDFAEIHERWDGKLPKEFINKVLKNINLFVSPEEIEFKIFRYLEMMLNKDEIEFDGIERKIKKRLDALVKEGLELTDSQEAILDEIANDMLQILVKHFVKVKSENKRKQQVIKTKADNNRKQQTITAQKNADTEAKTKRNVEAEAKKAETEARKAEATLKRKQIEAEEDALEEIKGKRRKWGCISIIAIIFIYSLLPSSIKSCQKEDESEDYVEEVADVTYIIDEGGIENLDISSVEEMLEKKFDYVSKYDNYFEIRKKGKYGIADLKGNIKIKPQYDYIGSPNEDLGAVEVRKDSKYGMVSLKTLNEIIETKYDYIGFVSEKSKTFEVRDNSKYGLYSANDLSEIVAPTYDYIGIYNEDTGLFEVRKDSKYGLFSPKKRKEVAPCEYNFISYDNGLYRVSKNGKNGYLNSDGSLVKPLQ